MSNIEKLVNLAKIVCELESDNYVIIKLSNIFPDYNSGDDIDIFCYNIHAVSRVILSNIQHIVSKEIKINIQDKVTQLHIDILIKNKIHFRFDLYESLPIYKNISIKESFLSSIIENSQIKDINGLNVKVPSDIDDAILRYIEYQEWYSLRPDKIKHVEYIEEKIKLKKIDINKVLDKLHFYISIPNNYEEIRKTSIVQTIKNTKLYSKFRKIRNKIKELKANP